MKFGTHIYIFTPRWTDESLSILDTTAELGLDCLEIAVGDDVTFDPHLTRKRAESLELDLIVSPGGAWPMECDLSSENPSQRVAALAWHQRQVELACQLGAVAYTGCLYGHPGIVKQHPPSPQQQRHIAQGLYRLADFAKDSSVAIVLEPMSHFRTHVVNTPQQAMGLVSMVDHPNLSILLDTYHIITEVRDYAEAISAIGDKLWGVHACENDRGVPGGGLVPWESVFRALREIGFDGYMLMESYNSSIGDFAYQHRMFHDVCSDGPDFVRRGLAFLKAGLHRTDEGA
ncbi:MAG: sugar phosphate isomerase/epimerase [Candidatus Nealsonbacteria bacterium]|nr:sugar phosphate isomerase/epimerase [Candidatus Nealsonbacteria bacterium]